MGHRQAGFTLIEVLVVAGIISLLAAIGISAYLGQRNRSYDTQAKNSVQLALAAAREYEIENGSYAGFDLTKAEPELKLATGAVSTGMWTNTAAAGPRDPRILRVATLAGNRCIFIGVRSRNKTGHFGVFDCRAPVTYMYGSSPPTPFQMPVGTFYGSAKNQVAATEREAIGELNQDYDND